MSENVREVVSQTIEERAKALMTEIIMLTREIEVHDFKHETVTDLLPPKIALHDLYKLMDASQKKIRKKMEDEVDKPIIDYCEVEGLTSFKTKEGRTVSVNSLIWMKKCEHSDEEICEALKNADLGAYVKEGFNSNSLSFYLRDLNKNEEEMPEELIGFIEANEKFTVGVRKS